MKRQHEWNDDACSVCSVCGCRREWKDFLGYWRFTWEDGRVIEPKGQGEPGCEGFSDDIIERCVVAALHSGKNLTLRETVKLVLGAYQGIRESAQAELRAQRAKRYGR